MGTILISFFETVTQRYVNYFGYKYTQKTIVSALKTTFFAHYLYYYNVFFFLVPCVTDKFFTNPLGI